MIHSLKTWKQYFQQIVDGQKTFEVRKNDRGFKVGDILILEEWDNETKEYTDREECFQIGFMLQGEFGLPADVCVMSLLNPEALPVVGGLTPDAADLGVHACDHHFVPRPPLWHEYCAFCNTPKPLI